MTWLDLLARPPLQGVGRTPLATGEAPTSPPPRVTVEPLDPTAFGDLLWQASQLGMSLSVHDRGPDPHWTAHDPAQVAVTQGGLLRLWVGLQVWQLQEADWRECGRWREAHRSGQRSGVLARAPGKVAICFVQDMRPGHNPAVGTKRCAWRPLPGRLVEDSRIDAGAAHRLAPPTRTFHA